MKNKKTLFFLLASALIIRLTVSIWSLQFRENPDVLRMRDWAGITHAYGVADSYRPTHLTFGTLANNAPPGEVYVMSAMYEMNVILDKIIIKTTHQSPAQIDHFSNQSLDILLRTPSILADLVIGALIFIYCNKVFERKRSLMAASCFLFNPVSIYNSAFWGQTDAIISLLFFIGVILLIENKIYKATLFFTLSLFVKLTLVYALPFFFVLIFSKSKSIKKTLLSIIISVFVILIFTLPISNSPISWFINFLMTNATGEIKNITAFAFNFWWFVFKPKIEIGLPTSSFNFSEIQLIGAPLSNQIFNGIPLSIWGGILFAFGTIPMFIWFKKITKPWNIFRALSIIVLCGFLFLPQMHERYIYPLFPLLALLVKSDKGFLKYLILISVFNFINLYLVWHPMLYPSLPFNLMNGQNFQWLISAGFLTTSIFLYKRLIQELRYEI